MDLIEKMAEAMQNRIAAGSKVSGDPASSVILDDEAARILAREAFNAIGAGGWCVYELDGKGNPKIPKLIP